MIIRRIVFFTILLGMFILDGCRTDTQDLGSADTSTERLSAGDVVKIALPGAPELNQTEKIRADGRVNLPIIGEVAAAGKTLTEFQADLANKYKTQLKNNDVLVTLESGAGQVTVSGAVTKP